jgi:Xaa-Pro aminopeptidase
MPVAVLEQRVARLQEAMRREGLDAVLAYTAIDRPSVVSWLTQFVPYWNEAVLVVPQRGGPVLLAAFSKRVQEWIREVSYLEDVMTAPRLGEGVVSLLERRLPKLAGARLGLIEADEFPWTIAQSVVKALGKEAIVDASPLFAGIRQPADQAEVGLAQRALALALRALDAVPSGARRAAEAIAAADASARLAGAEEVLFRVAPDLASSAVLQRIETDADLGARFALQLSLAYKGAWVRSTRCFSAGTPPASWRDAEQWFSRVAARVNDITPDAKPLNAPGKVAFWTLESCLGSHPLVVVAHGPARAQQAMPAPARVLPADALAVLSVQLELPEGAWHASTPVLLGANERRTRALVAA